MAKSSPDAPLRLRRLLRLLLAFTLPVSLVPASLRAEVVLQYFEAEWDEIYQRMPEIAEAGYDAIWTPSPAKSPQAGTIKWANVGYSLYDRFDLGDTPQRGTLGTRYGTRGDLRNMVDAAHRSDVKIYPDIVFNHNGNGPDFRAYPGMKINDFHAWADSGQPGGWRRAPRMTAYDDINNGNGGTFQQELVSLIDIVTEPDGRFGVQEPAPYVRHPGRNDLYPYGLPSNENVRQMLGRWIAWLGNAMDYDGLRLDAAKHVVREFYGTPGQVGGFLHEAQYNFDQRRGFADANEYDELYQNEKRRDDLLIFSEIFTGGSGTFDYWRGGNNKMRYLDFPTKQSIVGNAFSGGNLAALASIGVGLSETEGVTFVQSHDQDPPGRLELAHAWLLNHVGVPIVYFSGNNISWADYNARTWVKPGMGAALGDYNGTITNLVYISNNFARGREWGRKTDDNDYYAFERYEDLNGSATPDSGEATLLVALNDSGGDQTRTFATSFPNGTKLKDYTGNNADEVTVSGGQVTIRVPARGGQGFVCYAPYNATASGEAVRFIQGGAQVGTMNWVVPGGRDAPAKSRTIPRVTGNSVDIEVNYNDPVGGVVGDVIVKWGQGRNLNAGATDFTGKDVMKGGFEQASYAGPGGKWKLTADLTGVPEGLHVIKARVFNSRGASESSIFQTFTRTVYVDRSGPSLDVTSPAQNATINGETVATILNPDHTAGRVEVRVDGGAWRDAVQVMRGTWKASLAGLAGGGHALEVRATEFDNGNPQSAINTGTLTRNFNVNAAGPNIAINHAEGATISLPFFTTTITVDPGVAANSVRLYWDGWELAGLSGTGAITHTFDGRYISGGVTDRFLGAFINGPHFFEAEVTVNGQTRRIARTVTFNLYGSNQSDSDGDGLPDDVELPGVSGGLPANAIHPGDTNEDMIPNYGENWTRTNPLNQDTTYNGTWDGDEDWDNDTVSNLEEVRQGFIRFGNPYYYNIYDGNSKPQGPVAPQASWTLSNNGSANLAITYRPNDGALNGSNPIHVRVTTNTGSVQTFAMTATGSGGWTYTYAVPAGVQSVSLVFQNSGGSITDGNASYSDISVVAPVQLFNMDGQFDSAGYEIANSGMKILAAVRGGKLYLATWSPKGGGNDHFVFVTDKPGTSTPSPWAKAGVVHFNKTAKPYLAGEGSLTTPYDTFTNGGNGARSYMGAGGQALEGEIDLVQAFGSVPPILYIAAVACGTNDGGGITSQCPAPMSGLADNNLQPPDFQPVAVASLRDENGDGHFDGGRPYMETVVNGNTADANYGLRRFFLNELARDTGQVTVNLYPNTPPGAIVSNVEVVTNLNRRDFAAVDDDLAQATTTSQGTYYRAYAMAPIANGGFTATIPVTRCGAYRINARYRVNGGTPVYYTDSALRRDCAVVVSPKKAQTAVIYEVNPSVIEATAPTFAGRSTFRDLHTANSDRPDIVNLGHFPGIGVNTLWLQPVHPIGTEAQSFDPGSPYAVRDYWKVSPILGAANTEAGAMGEFSTFVGALDGAGVGVMMDGTFNHCAPDAVVGQGAADLFPWATDPNAKIRDVRPQWFSKEGAFDQPAANAGEIAVAPDRSDFGKWTDVRDLFFGDYDALVKDASDATQQNYLLERDAFAGHTASTREVWEYFGHYPVYWLAKTGHPAGTPPEQSYKGIDGLRCDFAQGLPSKFWEYCINKTRSVKWDFLFMAESLDGFRSVGSNKRHGVSYRSARHFDILNENIVFYWRDQFFAYPANGPGSAGTPNPATYPTWQAYDDRRNAYDNVVLLNNLTSHDEVFPSNDPYRILYAYAQVAALDGIPMIMYGQEAGARNDVTSYGFSGVPNGNNNWEFYETNFGKSIPNFKRYNAMTKVWQNRDWNVQTLYGRINNARRNSPALRSQEVYFLSRPGGAGYDPDIFAVAKMQKPGVSASVQDVVLAFVNNNHAASPIRWGTFSLNAALPDGSNWFGIQPTHDYNLRDLASADPNAPVWTTPVSGATLIAGGITVGLTANATTGGQAQYLKLVDVTESTAGQVNNYASIDFDNDALTNDWESANGLDPRSPAGNDGAAGDKDGDGKSNYDEFIAGTNPGSATSRFAVKTLAPAGPDFDLTWRSVPGNNYRVRWSSDLANWQPLTGTGSTADPMTITADGDETTIRLGLPPAPNLFFRVELKR